MINIYQKIFFLLFNSKNIEGVLELDIDGRKHKLGNELVSGKRDKISGIEIKILDNRFFRRVILFGDIGFGESFFKKYFSTSNLDDVLKFFIQNREHIPGFNAKNPLFFLFEWTKSLSRVLHLLNKNTKKGSRRNIKKHYDVSNDFYSLWLDETMAYSAAIFENGLDLKDAQINKYRTICDKLKLNKNDHLLEIGSGWGGFAIFAAKNYGCRITTITISKEQFYFAKEKIKNEGLGDKIEIRLEDYRDLDGQYDKIVSIEMMEALGNEYVGLFVKKCHDLLKMEGLICYQCITFPDKQFKDYLKNNNYIKKYIFPGGELISIAQLKKEIKKLTNLYVLDIESIGLDYAKTLDLWKENFVRQKDKILKLGFDDEFCKKWLYYFIYCKVGFETRYLDDVQIVIHKIEA